MLGGKPMLEWSVNALAPVVDHVVVALPPGEEPPPGTIGAEGGEHRSQSVRNALAAAPEGDPVVIHDAARPLITADLVREAIAALGDHDAAVAATPVADTIKEADGAGEVVRTLPRARLWAVQTPQVVRRRDLEAAFETCPLPLEQVTDDLQLIELARKPVWLVGGEERNLKVTTQTDLRIAEMLLATPV